MGKKKLFDQAPRKTSLKNRILKKMITKKYPYTLFYREKKYPGNRSPLAWPVYVRAYFRAPHNSRRINLSVDPLHHTCTRKEEGIILTQESILSLLLDRSFFYATICRGYHRELHRNNPQKIYKRKKEEWLYPTENHRSELTFWRLKHSYNAAKEQEWRL